MLHNESLTEAALWDTFHIIIIIQRQAAVLQ